MSRELYDLQDEAIKAMNEIDNQVPKEIKEFWDKVYLANVKVFKAWSELHDIIELNETNVKKLNLLNKRLKEYINFIVDIINDIETQKVLIDKFEELFSILKNE